MPSASSARTWPATSLTEARALIGEFIARYNAEWPIERLGHRTPSAARAAALAA